MELAEKVSDLEARIAATKDVIGSGYPAIPDPARKGWCIHNMMFHEDCIGCYDEALLAALDPPHA